MYLRVIFPFDRHFNANLEMQQQSCQPHDEQTISSSSERVTKMYETSLTGKQITSR